MPMRPVQERGARLGPRELIRFARGQEQQPRDKAGDGASDRQRTEQAQLKAAR